MSCGFKRLPTGLFGVTYTCGKDGKEIDTAWLKKYCNTSSKYLSCPRYKSESSGSGCYLSTACALAKQLPDDCEELTLLRQFRDGYLQHRIQGKEEIASYYEISSKIVLTINAKENAHEIYARMYEELVLPCVQMIKADQYEAAYNHYKHYTLELNLLQNKL